MTVGSRTALCNPCIVQAVYSSLPGHSGLLEPDMPRITVMRESSAHRARVTAFFDRIAESYERANLRFYPFAADRMVYKLRVAPGEKVLDVATGPGTAALAAARLAGPKGRVTGIDMADRMIDRAFENAQRQGLSNLDLHTMDGEHLEFRSGYFDVVMCGAGLYYMEDMSRAVKEWRRVLKPGGRLMFTGFGVSAFQPMAEMLVEMLRARGLALASDVPPLAWSRLSQPPQYSGLLAEVGMNDIQVENQQLGYHLGGADEWWDVVWNSDMRALVEQIPAGELGRFRVDYQEAVQALAGMNGIWMDVETIFAGGIRPVDSG